MDVPIAQVAPPVLLRLLRLIGTIVPSLLRQRILFVGSPCIDESSIGLLSHVNRREALLSLQVVWRSLAALEKRLPSKLFFRANRSQLLNLSCIESVVPWFNNGLKVKLNGGHEVEIARRPAKLFRERLRF